MISEITETAVPISPQESTGTHFSSPWRCRGIKAMLPPTAHRCVSCGTKIAPVNILVKAAFAAPAAKRIFTLALLFFVTNAFGQAVRVSPLEAITESGTHYLEMRVWNCSNRDIEVPLADLPWGQYTLGLVLYPGGKLAGEPLKESVPLADVPDTATKIPAKSYIDGKVDLDDRFHDISRYEKSENLLIFWEYDLSLITRGDSQIVGGMIPLYGGNHFVGDQKMGCGSTR